MAESSDLSEWQRSADDAAAPTARKMPGTATGRHNQICGRGGIGRHVGFRFQWISVQVQVLSPVPKEPTTFNRKLPVLLFMKIW